jgi:dihydroorotate dehydrogenase (NAD+) catalytic subunit
VTVQLAPQHKVGLLLKSPLLLANCTAELLSLCDRDVLGAVVAPEIGGVRRRPRRVVERPGGVLVEVAPGAHSISGLRRLVQAAGDLPVLGRVTAAEPRGAVRAAVRLEEMGVSALEVDLQPGDPGLARTVLAALRDASQVPLLARVPLAEAVTFARAACDLADALVVAAPPQGLAPLASGEPARAVEVHGPLLHPLVLRALREVRQAVDLRLVARGGILTAGDARAFIAEGASAVETDSLAIVEPAAVGAIGRELRV